MDGWREGGMDEEMDGLIHIGMEGVSDDGRMDGGEGQRERVTC